MRSITGTQAHVLRIVFDSSHFQPYFPNPDPGPNPRFELRGNIRNFYVILSLHQTAQGQNDGKRKLTKDESGALSNTLAQLKKHVYLVFGIAKPSEYQATGYDVTFDANEKLYPIWVSDTQAAAYHALFLSTFFWPENRLETISVSQCQTHIHGSSAKKILVGDMFDHHVRKFLKQIETRIHVGSNVDVFPNDVVLGECLGKSGG